MFELVLVVEHRVVELSVHPHAEDDFEPTLAQATQGIGVTTTFLTMRVVVDLGPDASGQGLLGKEVNGMAQVLVTGPSLVARPALGVSVDFAFAGATGHRRGTRQALQSLWPLTEAIPVVTDFGQKTRGKLRSCPG